MTITKLMRQAAVATMITGAFGATAVAQDNAAKSTPEIERGRALYDSVAGIGCVACHGLYGEGDVGPYNRGVDLGTIKAAIDGVEDMTFLREEMTEEDIEAIAAYTKWLGNTDLFKVLLKRGRFVPGEITVEPGKSVQLVVASSALDPVTVQSADLGIKKEIPARDQAAVIWTAPEKEGVYSVECTDCDPVGNPLTVNVAR